MSTKSVKKANVPVSIRNRMEKIYSYIKYCQRLEDAYRTKHEEVRVLNDYLKRIQRVLPENVSEKCPEVEDIITYIEGLPDVPDTDDLNETLKQMIEQQRIWREESTRNYNLINRKIGKMSEAREVLSVSGNNKTKTRMNNKTKTQMNKKAQMNRGQMNRAQMNKTRRNNKAKRTKKKVSAGITFVPATPIKRPGINKMVRRNAIRNRKTKVVGKPK